MGVIRPTNTHCVNFFQMMDLGILLQEMKDNIHNPNGFGWTHICRICFYQ